MDVHGTSTSYGNGCRCDVCRAGRATYAREWRKRNPDRGKVPKECAGCGTTFLAWPDNTRNGRPQKYCSPECAGIVPGSGKRPSLYRPSHPLAGKDGRVLEHRMVLYDAIGPGPHPCHWCGVQIDWVVRVGRSSAEFTDLISDHLDGDPQHNAVENLVPACQRCNVVRGAIGKWERDTGSDIGVMSHHLYPKRLNTSQIGKLPLHLPSPVP